MLCWFVFTKGRKEESVRKILQDGLFARSQGKDRHPSLTALPRRASFPAFPPRFISDGKSSCLILSLVLLSRLFDAS